MEVILQENKVKERLYEWMAANLVGGLVLTTLARIPGIIFTEIAEREWRLEPHVTSARGCKINIKLIVQ